MSTTPALDVSVRRPPLPPRPHARLSLALLLGASLLSGSAHAQQAPCLEPAKVKALKDRGDEAMEAGRPAEALVAYEQAFAACREAGTRAPALTGGPGEARAALLYNLGRAHLALGDYARALTYLEDFERAASPELRARVPGLRELVDEQRNHVGSLTVTSNVPGAKIRLREKPIGATPLVAMRLNSGHGVLEVTAEGYLPFTKEVELRPGALTAIEANLVPRAQVGTLAVRSSVENALVFIDGNPYGRAPVENKVPIGPHRVLVRLEGYRDADQQLTLAQGERKELTLSPERIEPITAKWWFWATVGVVVAAGTTTTILAATSERAADRGNLGPGTIVATTFHPVRF